MLCTSTRLRQEYTKSCMGSAYGTPYSVQAQTILGPHFAHIQGIWAKLRQAPPRWRRVGGFCRPYARLRASLRRPFGQGCLFQTAWSPPTRLFALPAHSASSAHASMWTGFAGSRNLLVSATFCAPRSWGCRRTCANLYCRSGYFGTQTWRRVTDEDGWWRRHRAPTRDTTMNAWSLNPAWGRVSVPRGRSLA